MATKPLRSDGAPRQLPILRDGVARDLLHSPSRSIPPRFVAARRATEGVRGPRAPPGGAGSFAAHRRLRPANGMEHVNLSMLDAIDEIEQRHEEEELERARAKAGAAGAAALRSAAHVVLNADAGGAVEAALPQRLQLSIWVDAFARELRAHRSAVIAAELLLHRVAQCCDGQPGPSLLSTASALVVLTVFLPNLGRYAELMRGIIEELAHAVYVSPSKSIGVSTSAEVYAHKPFFESFADVARAFRHHRKRAKRFSLMMDREQRVLDRAVLAWQRSVCRKQLQKWRAYTRRCQALRSKYARVFAKASTSGIVQRAVLLWRQYAHDSYIGVAESRNTLAMEELQVMQRKQRQLQERLAALEDDAQRREQRIKDVTGSLARARRHMSEALQRSETQRQVLLKLRATWIEVASGLFGDAQAVPETCDPVAWLHSVIASGHSALTRKASQSSSSPLRRAASLADVGGNRSKIESQQLLRLMRRVWPHGVAMPPEFRRGGAADQSIMAAAEAVCVLFRILSRNAPPPLATMDIARGDQLRMRALVVTILEMYGGGHCSCFFPSFSGPWAPPTPAPQRRTSTWVAFTERGDDALESTVSLPPSAVGVPFTSLLDNLAAPPESCGNEIVEQGEAALVRADWNSGRQLLSHVPAVNAAVQKTFAEATQLAETVELYRDSKRLFDAVAVARPRAGRVVPRGVLEDSLRRFTDPQCMPTIQLLYPRDDVGITGITDVVHYVMEVAEVVNRPASNVLRNLEDHLVVSTAMHFLADVRGDDVQFVLKTFSSEVRTLFSSLAVLGPSRLDGQGGSSGGRPKDRSEQNVNSEGFLTFVRHMALNTGTEISHEAALTLFSDFCAVNQALIEGREGRTDVVDEQGFQALLCAAAVYHEPSPFVPLRVKLDTFLQLLFHESHDFAVSQPSLQL